jgi:hypothetical protein
MQSLTDSVHQLIHLVITSDPLRITVARPARRGLITNPVDRRRTALTRRSPNTSACQPIKWRSKAERRLFILLPGCRHYCMTGFIFTQFRKWYFSEILP